MPVEHPEQLYKVGKEIECCVDGGLQGDWRIFSYDLYRHLRDQTPGTDGMAATQAGAIQDERAAQGGLGGAAAGGPRRLGKLLFGAGSEAVCGTTCCVRRTTGRARRRSQ